MKTLNMVLNTTRLCLCLNLAALCCFSFALTCSAQQRQNESADIRHIENGITPITGSGKDSGSTRSILNRMHELKIPGLSIAVFDQGRIIWTRSYGYRNLALKQKVDANTVFQAASLSKPLTSVAMFELAEQQMIRPDEDINQQLHSWKVPDNGFTREHKVTPEGIVCHEAGFNVHGFAGYRHRDTIPTLLQILNGEKPANSPPIRVVEVPGIKESYSGGGFEVLQLLLQEVTGKSFPALMNDLVIGPAGMRRSAFSLRIPAALAGNFAAGYVADGSEVTDGYDIYPEQAAAGLWTTPSDLVHFLLNIDGAYLGRSGLLKQPTVKYMLTKVPGGGGSGFGVDHEGTADIDFRHSGGNYGYTCYEVCFAENGKGVVIMTNSDNGSQLMHELVRDIARVYGWPAMWPHDK